MATQEKLLKSLESLRNLINAKTTTENTAKKKEKIQHCNFIVEAMTNPTIKIAPKFNTLLTISMEILLKLCDDAESDVRMVADECLNKLIRAMVPIIGKIQIELHKEIKKNASVGSLRAALTRFSQLAHHIRPHKGKIYVTSLIPYLVKINERPEEAIHETIANSLPKMFMVLAGFTSDNDIKTLLKSFLNNIAHTSPAIRRTTSSSIQTVCNLCRKPHIFLNYSLNHVIDMLVPIQDNHTTSHILGSFMVLKLLLPNFVKVNSTREVDIKGSARNQKQSMGKPIDLDKYLQVYELCLYYTSNTDHNIVNAALETLHVLLNDCPNELKLAITSTNGIVKSRLSSFELMLKHKQRSPSQTSIATTMLSEDNLLLEPDTDSINTNIEKWIDESKLTVISMNYVEGSNEEKQSQSTTSYSNNESNTTMTSFDIVESTCDYSNITMGEIGEEYDQIEMSESVNDELSKLLLLSENSSDKSFSQKDEDKIATSSIKSHSYKDIDIGTFLDKNIPLIYCTRLLIKQFLLTGSSPSRMISDRDVRVSVKNLAFTCLASIFRIEPSILLLPLEYNERTNNPCANDKTSSSQPIIGDLVLYETHADPQLRGALQILVGEYLKTVFISNREKNYSDWVTEHSQIDRNDGFQLGCLLRIIIKGLHDESSHCIRQTLSALCICLKYILESADSGAVLEILDELPFLGKNPHWLVKVKLLELITNLNYITIQYVCDSSEFQAKIIYNVLFELIKDDDQRVRNATSQAFVKIVSALYFSEDYSNDSHIINKAITYKNGNSVSCSDQIDSNIKQQLYIANMPFPFKSMTQKPCKYDEDSLTRLVAKLHQRLLMYSSKYAIYGCIETLSLLITEYPTTKYRKAWNCYESYNVAKSKTVFQRSQSITGLNQSTSNITVDSTGDLLNVCVNLLTNSIYCYDIRCHWNLLRLTGNLFSGKSIHNLTLIGSKQDRWNMFSDKTLMVLAELILTHIVRMLNIFYHVIDEVQPVLPNSKPSLPNLATSASNLSPIKRRNSEAADKKLISPTKMVDKDEKSDKRNDVNAKINSKGFFTNLPHYMKMFEVVKLAYNNYKITLENNASENFLSLLKSTLSTLSQILEIATLTETGRISEEILTYLRSTFKLEPSYTVECVQQLFKSLFGTNLTADPTELLHKSCKRTQEIDVINGSFYSNIIHKPYEEISSYVNQLISSGKIEVHSDTTLMGYLHRKESLKSNTKESDLKLTSYIKIFEPMVITSLKQYTITTDVKLQSNVLGLINQLIQQRINYCLLDSGQVFLGFVIKQFEFIEQGQILLSDELIPKIFQFLVLLSYSKQHSKSIIGVPKIMQLCDVLMASGQSPLTHCIPALKPIIEDIFLLRNKANTPDFQELETTREVLLSMLLRLMEHSEAMEQLILVLNEAKYCDNSEKWLRWSKQILDVLLISLKQDKIRFEDKYCFSTLKKLILVINPIAFRPINPILLALFTDPPQKGETITNFNRWLGKMNTLLLIVLQLKEDHLLNKITELVGDFSPQIIFSNITRTVDPLNVTKVNDLYEGMSAEMIFVYFIFRIFDVISGYCSNLDQSNTTGHLDQQCSQFLVFCSYIFQSGSHCKISNLTVQLINDEKYFTILHVDLINKYFLGFEKSFPLLTCQWCYLLALLSNNNRKYWSKVLQVTESYGILRNIKDTVIPQTESINKEILRIGAILAYSDYMCENMIDGEEISWLIVNNIKLMIVLLHENPVIELVNSIHRNLPASGLFIQAITTKCLDINDLEFKTKLLKSVENVHPSQNGALICLLLPNLLNTKQLCISRLVANLASKKIEYLLALTMEQVTVQLAKDDLLKISEQLVLLKLAKRHESLVTLLNRLSTQFYDLSPVEFNQTRSINPDYITKLEVNKNWYISQIKSRCTSLHEDKNTAYLLTKLEYEDILSILSQKDFNKSILKYCFKYANRNSGNTKSNDLLKASIESLLNDVRHVVSMTPKNHQTYNNTSQQDLKYQNRLRELLHDSYFFQYFTGLIPPVISLLHIPETQLNSLLTDADFYNLFKFSVLALESILYTLSVNQRHLDIGTITSALNCAEATLVVLPLSLVTRDTTVTRLCSAVSAVYRLMERLLQDYEPLPVIHKISRTEGQSLALKACYQLSVLVTWFGHGESDSCLQMSVRKSVCNVVIALSRLPIFNSYVLTPPMLWRNGWDVKLTGSFKTVVPPLPIEYLQENDILEEFISRSNFIGWTTRQQFEETWVCLLCVLSNVPEEDSMPEEIHAIAQSTSLSVQAITSLLMQTLYFPDPGNNITSKMLHIPRYLTTLNTISSNSIIKLKTLQDNFSEQLKEVFPNNQNCRNVFDGRNLEKYGDNYTFGQLSVQYLWLSAKVVEITDKKNSASKMYTDRENALRKVGLDINSCLQFLIDLYTQWIKSTNISLKLLHEVVKSILTISDLFTEKSQFSWMLEMFMDLSKTHPIEDEIIHQYFVVGICKAAAVLTPEIEVYELIKKNITIYLKSAFLPARFASLHGLLYILEGCTLGNTVIGGISDEVQLLLPVILEYILCNITTKNGFILQQEHTLLLWSLAFFLIENIDVVHLENEFVDVVSYTAIGLLSDVKINLVIYNSLMKGLERLVILRKLHQKTCDNIMKFAIDQTKNSNPVIAIPAIQLLFTSMYVVYSDQLDNTDQSNGVVQTNPDHLVQTIEKITTLFDRIKRGYEKEAQIISAVLPLVLNDFFAPSDILTKVIGEFLSTLQQYPKFLSKVVFQLFQRAIKENQILLLQDWMVFSLSIFTQSTSIGMSTWYLTCFFISASSNEYLQNLFPYVQSRMGRYEYEDRKILCIAASDFYKKLSVELKTMFVEAFTKVRHLSETPFNDLLACL